MWFRPTKAGHYIFFCSQYCGTDHAMMTGWVTVMEPSDYAAWLTSWSNADTDPSANGEQLFAQKACSSCHIADGTGGAPSLNGLYGGTVRLADGSTVTADESYIRESIIAPNAKIVAGYLPVMPGYQGQLSEDQTLSLIAYIKSLQSQPVPTRGAGVVVPGNK
jgi:cytochrome c oxidase subunit II